MPPFDYNSNPAIPGTMPSNQLQDPRQRGSWGGDYSGQLNDMLAPYKQQAEKMSSPYATMSPNSWLAKNHPGVAGILDNAFLTMGSTPGPQGPEGVGGGISRMMQGLMGGQQFRRQQMMQNMMMPYQMLEPQLKAQDMLSLRDERYSAGVRADAYNQTVIEGERHHGVQEDLERQRMEKQDRAKALAGPDMTDDKGNAWSRVFDPVAGRVSLKHAVTGQDANELPQDQQPTFENEKKDARRGTPGGMMGEIIGAQMSKDPAVHARGLEMGKIYSNLYGQQAGARTGAEQNAPHPYTDTKTLIAGERAAALKTIPSPVSATDFQNQQIFGLASADPETKKSAMEYMKSPQKAYETYRKSLESQKQQTSTDLAKYERSTAPRSGVGFNEYLQNREQYDGVAPTQAPPPEAANAPRAVDKAWTYKP